MGRSNVDLPSKDFDVEIRDSSLKKMPCSKCVSRRQVNFVSDSDSPRGCHEHRTQCVSWDKELVTLHPLVALP